LLSKVIIIQYIQEILSLPDELLLAIEFGFWPKKIF